MKKKYSILCLISILFLSGCTAAREAASNPDSRLDPHTMAGSQGNLTVASTDAAEPMKIGQVLAKAHGTKCFTVATVALNGDTIVGAVLDDYQFMEKENAVGVPNSDADFADSIIPGKVLASKRINNVNYSAEMANAGATQTIEANFHAIESFAMGKTTAELNQFLSAKTPEEVTDAISGATLVDTKGYLTAIVTAAESTY